MKLSERKKRILKIVVENYISSAEPVSSKTIAAQMGGSISAATIRNELAALVQHGYLEQPHTSAGRIPTPRGYRLYVNELMEQQRLSMEETLRIQRALQLKMEELDRVLAQAGRAVASVVDYPAYMAAAGKTHLTAQRFELLSVDEKRCIVVIMMGDQRVKSRLLRLQLQVEPSQLPILAEVLNTHFTHQTADEMNETLLSMTEQMPPQMFLLLSQIIAYATDVLEDAGQREVVTAGVSRLLKLPEFQDTGKAHALMSFLADSKESLPVPTEDIPMQFLIGPENVSEALKNTSVVMASYDIGNDMRGLIGVVGPTRMDYAAVAAQLAAFAEGMARMFGRKELSEENDP